MRVDELEQRIPPLTDAALVDFASSITVNRDHVQYRPRRTFFEKVWEAVTGAEARRQNQIDQNLNENQATLFKYAEWLLDRQRIGDVALRITQKRLLETREHIRSLAGQMEVHGVRLNQLVERFDTFETRVDRRLGRLEAEVQHLNAIDVVTDAIEAWESGATYQDLPFLIQLNLVAAEVVGRVGPVLLSDEIVRGEVRRRFINRCVLALGLGEQVYTVQDLLRSQMEELRASDKNMILALIDPRIMEFGPAPTPLLFSLGTTLELSQLEGVDHRQSAALAVHLTEQNGMEVQRVYGAREITRIAFEENIEQSFRRARVLEAA